VNDSQASEEGTVIRPGAECYPLLCTRGSEGSARGRSISFHARDHTNPKVAAKFRAAHTVLGKRRQCSISGGYVAFEQGEKKARLLHIVVFCPGRILRQNLLNFGAPRSGVCSPIEFNGSAS